jgi:hypothetical protein
MAVFGELRKITDEDWPRFAFLTETARNTASLEEERKVAWSAPKAR